MIKCSLSPVAVGERGIIYACAACGRLHESSRPLENIRKVCAAFDQPVIREPVANGVGFMLHAMLVKLGVKPKAECQCLRLAREMDQLGPDGCRREFDRLKAAISENYDALSWGEKQLAKVRASFTSLPWQLDDWSDPVGSMLRLAIERAEKSTA